MSSNSKVKIAKIDRKTFDSTIGDLDKILLEYKNRCDEQSNALENADPPLPSIVRRGMLSEDETSATVVCTTKKGTMTLRLFSKAAVVSQKQQGAVMREMDILKNLSMSPEFLSCLQVPTLVSTNKDANFLYVLYKQAACCTVANLVDEFEGVWEESSVRHVASCVLKGLECIHSLGVVYRGITPETLLVCDNGNVLLANFQYARQSSEGNMTICGAPEYLAPEVVQQQGHGLASDFWTIGVVLYELLQNETPFVAPQELDVYAKICRHRSGTLHKLVKEGTPLSDRNKKPCLDFIDRLIRPDPLERINFDVAKADPWFAADKPCVTPGSKILSAAKENLEQRLSADDATVDKAKAYKGANDWCAKW